MLKIRDGAPPIVSAISGGHSTSLKRSHELCLNERIKQPLGALDLIHFKPFLIGLNSELSGLLNLFGALLFDAVTETRSL